MKLLAIFLAIIGLTKLFISYRNEKVDLRKLLSDIQIHSDIVDSTAKAIIIIDGLIGFICGLFILFAI